MVNREVGVIVDSKNLHESYYIIAKFPDILEILIPIFSKYYFTTSKFLDFQDLKAAAEIRKTSYMEKRKLNTEELKKILIIKSNMNSQRLEFNIKDLPAFHWCQGDRPQPYSCTWRPSCIRGAGSLDRRGVEAPGALSTS